ncbi:MAG: AAA family ATPase [Candidatus Pacebacteria bacterium]|nr:AAA family ATPase [Candidatus Paceibacterota bacterium]
MNISQIKIKNFKCFKGEFSLKLNKGLNILVGDNETGKSTILEAIHLALSGLLNGRYLKIELSQYLFNNDVRNEYLENFKEISESETVPLPPEILIEIFIDDIEDETLKALFEGNGNSTKQKACGIQFKIALNETHQAYYEELVKCGDVQSIPIEYYDFSWSSFARDERVTPKIIPIKSALIDSSSNRYHNGSDIYISRILKDHLEDSDKIKIEQAYRKMRDAFMNDSSIKDVNVLIKDAINISNKKVELSVDLSSKNAWETTLTTYLDDVPFHHVGKGEQCIVKTKLALSHKQAQRKNVLLLEEPENHLSHTKLNELIKHIQETNEEKQVIISTHSSFVANKLGLGSLILLNVDSTTNQRTEIRFDDLKPDTKNYFAKLSGYDTLRLILCKKVILVEGDSDELIIQMAYKKSNEDRLPIHDQIDVISVGTAFLRFLEIAEKINKPVAVVTDNDGDVNLIKEKYKNYLGDNKKDFIEICFDETEDTGDLKIGKNEKPFNYNTLEPKILKSNDLEKLNMILGTTYANEDELHKYMRSNKTDCALKIFDTKENVSFPQYILNAIQ